MDDIMHPDDKVELNFTGAEVALLATIVEDYKKRLGSRSTTPKGMTFDDALNSLRLAARIGEKLG